MPKGNNQKYKFTYLMRIMLEMTDDDHGLTMPQIMKELERYDVTAERKSIYNDFADMTDKFGIEINKTQVGRETYYSVGAREFELAEVKLLIDAIQSSKFITKKKSKELISKVKKNVSVHQAKQLDRQVYIADRVKTMNESVYYNVDYLHSAINGNHKIKFKYLMWNIKKELVPKHEDEWTVASPWALTWDDENYYLVAYDDKDCKMKHYRVDKMVSIRVLENEKRDGRKEFGDFDMAAYSKATFGMYGGEKRKVTIRFENNMCGVLIDRFGKDIPFKPVDKDHTETHVDVNVSPQFFGWIFGLGKRVQIIGPEDVVDALRKEARTFSDLYK